MQAITTIGLDIAKSVFQVHGVDAKGAGSRREMRRLFNHLLGLGADGGKAEVPNRARKLGKQRMPILACLVFGPVNPSRCRELPTKVRDHTVLHLRVGLQS